MEALLFLLLIVLAVWLQNHAQSTREKLKRIEQEQLALRERLAKWERSQRKAPPTDATAPKPQIEPTPSPAPEQKTEPSPAPTVREPAPPTPPPLPDRTVSIPIPRRSISWRPLLEKVKLWPPTGENAEAAIASWWLTRIGLVILIIAAVFFGVRIAEDTPPALRLAALAAISAGVSILGLWLERRLTAFGRLISAGGLGLGYFTAFAAYGVEATKVIDQAGIGFALQVIAVVIVIAWSLWKRDEAIAAMAVLLGYVACWFSHAHDLHQFVIASLLMLAAGAGAMLRLRGWLGPHAISIAGSWAGFLILGIFEWSKAGAAPTFPIILGSLIGMTAILEIANLISGKLSPHGVDSASGKWFRRLAVINTSLAVGAGWLAVRLAFPGNLENRELDLFYLSFAIILGIFAALRYRSHHPVVVTETYFLKASGLLALFLVAWFDGPTRWLSLSAQTLVMLWAWRRSRLVWIEAGFGALLITTLVVLGHDISHHHAPSPPGEWRFFTLRHGVGLLSLTLLSIALALHATSGGDRPIKAIRLIAGLAAGGLLTALVASGFTGSIPSGAVILLTLGALVIALPAMVFRQTPPVAAGLVALISACILFLRLAPSIRDTAPAIWAGLWLSVASLGSAEIALRLWKEHLNAGRGIRLLLHGLGLLIVGVTLHRALDAGNATPLIPIIALFGYATLVALTLVRQGAAGPGFPFLSPGVAPAISQGFLALVGGILVTAVGLDLLSQSPYHASWLALAGGVLFTTAHFTRNATPAIAGGIPLVIALFAHLLKFGDHSPLGIHLLAAAPIIGVCVVAALALRRANDPARLWFDAALVAVSLIVIHWFFRCHFAPSQVLAADAALAFLLAITASLRQALPTQALVAPLLLLLAIVNLAHRAQTGHDLGRLEFWWIAAAFIGAWVWASGRFLDGRLSDRTGSPALITITAIAALGLTVAGYHALDAPWHPVSLGLFAGGLCLLGTFTKNSITRALSLLPLASAIPPSVLLIAETHVDTPSYALTSICLCSALVVAHGVMLTWRETREARSLSWLHGLIALGLTFPAFASGRLGVDALTTVCWGVASVCLFIVGLVAGLRPYRLAGLIGLALAMVRMFVVDIDDPLYRIYAFFVIALVLLGIGYLYHRFRHLIEKADARVLAESENLSGAD